MTLHDMLVVTNQWSCVTLMLLRQQYDVVTSLSIKGKTVPPATQIHVFRVAVRLTWITLCCLVTAVQGYDQKLCQDENLSAAFNSAHLSKRRVIQLKASIL
jgi:hypothetical protein